MLVARAGVLRRPPCTVQPTPSVCPQYTVRATDTICRVSRHCDIAPSRQPGREDRGGGRGHGCRLPVGGAHVLQGRGPHCPRDPGEYGGRVGSAYFLGCEVVNHSQVLCVQAC
jgi:hypothetical protein